MWHIYVFCTAELVENALIDWLPGQKLFDRFSGEKKKAAQGNR